MKRDAYDEDEDAIEDFNSWLDNGNGIEIGKRGAGKCQIDHFDVEHAIYHTAHQHTRPTKPQSCMTKVERMIRLHDMLILALA